MFKVSELYIYPIKSLRGIKVNKATVTDKGFEYDRRWMLVDDNNHFVSQREVARMALLKTTITDKFLEVTDTSTNRSTQIPLSTENKEAITVSVWDDHCLAILVNREIDAWFTEALGINVRLVYMTEDSHRFVEDKYANANQITSFADAFPFLLIGSASLDDLNSRLEVPVPINRFRPNIVFIGADPYFEDIINEFTINDIRFAGAKLCARCNMVTIDQESAINAKEPIKTLAGYRRRSNKIYFGQNLIHQGSGMISVGDQIKILTTHTEERFIIQVNRI